ncbi:chromosomal partitioning protein ParB [Pararhizobium polonicum]|uniref:Chromosomal partitioning protein ParB n=1 Tax=Pararhizobium polonicum TaxID=1612624 RepID=A0A1C7NSS7_9HYPH|nr:plasmid partitioning protein RepB [Pararhizobium polonicum]OBZ92043.1 chromosomal partitioning protein ParB [Pararhizobium polonicum]
MSRKDTLKAMLSRREQELPGGNPEVHLQAHEADAIPEKKLHHIRSGAVGAMGRSLGNIANAADQARALIAAGSAVVEIPTDRIEGSFVTDRLLDDGEAFQRLTDAIRESGQKSPILVRPHPTNPENYQIAFGHRRVRVLAALGRPVKAVVQNLSDEELVVIQGQENSARSDLSYIERGLFALALEERGFDRRVIMSSLGMEKTQLSKLMSVAHSVPRALIEAIGPAPKAGRPRWIALAERLAQTKKQTALSALLGSGEFKVADTDSRFGQVMAFLSAQPAKKKAEIVKSAEGVKLALIERSGAKVNLVFDDRTAPAFADYIAAQLEQLHQSYLAEQERKAR